MGAIEAFTKAFSIILENRKLYVLTLILALTLAPLGAYTLSGKVPLENNATAVHSGSVIFEEYGSPAEENGGALIGFFERLMVYVLVALVVASIFEYGVVKGGLMHIEGRDAGIGTLLGEGLRRFPAVFLINLIYAFIGLAILSIGLIPMVIGLMTMPGGAVLVFLGLVLLLVLGAFTLGLSLLPVPTYVEEGNFGAAFKAIGMSTGNALTTIGFGFLVMVAVLGISAVSGPITFLTQMLVGGKTGEYVSAFLQAPFTALLYEFLWVSGAAFYKELKKREELKKVDEELAELGIDL